MKTIEAVVVILAIGLVIAVAFNVWQYNSYQQLNYRLDTLNKSFFDLNQKFNAITHEEWTQYRSVANSSLGLKFDMSLNTTFLQPGQPISITLCETNTLSTFNNVTASDGWKYSGFQDQTCGNIGISNRPFTVAIIKGYYTESELNETSSLPIFHALGMIYYCPFIMPPYEYDFYPASVVAIIKSSFQPMNETIISMMAFGGYYELTQIQNGEWTQQTQSLINFSQGVYTVVAGDEWGQLIVLHFIVL